MKCQHGNQQLEACCLNIGILLALAAPGMLNELLQDVLSACLLKMELISSVMVCTLLVLRDEYFAALNHRDGQCTAAVRGFCSSRELPCKCLG